MSAAVQFRHSMTVFIQEIKSHPYSTPASYHSFLGGCLLPPHVPHLSTLHREANVSCYNQLQSLCHELFISVNSSTILPLPRLGSWKSTCYVSNLLLLICEVLFIQPKQQLTSYPSSTFPLPNPFQFPHLSLYHPRSITIHFPSQQKWSAYKCQTWQNHS